MTEARDSAGTVAAIVNPIKGDVMRVRQSIARHAYDSDAGRPLWFETTRDDDGATAAAEAAAAGARLVIASGGDGTIRSVAAALRNTGTALGIVPSGTGNLLARNLGIPIGHPDAAVELAFTGADRVVDVGIAEFTSPDERVTEHPFMVVAGVGVDAAMIANTSPALKQRIGWIAYVDGVLRSVFVSKPTHTKLRVERPGGEDTVRSFDAHSVLVGNVGALPGGVELLPGALIDDGVLDVAVMHPKTVFGWLYIGRAVMWENHVLRRTGFGRKMMSFRSRVLPNVLEYTRGPVVSLKLDHPLDAELDGDAFGLVTAARFRTDPRSLIVRVPPEVARVP
ncbi:diacylglycerol/lipid kinase family protein [Gryllotalpicola reticulitermitis]|uniref:Diacylglycerol/lipid kinase family protein n=1 Tax=Gryllotalpicola reticulitermitis TaxID=1184153 RepID=A0ABV8Q768_9MICO